MKEENKAKRIDPLLQETLELIKILSTILQKMKKDSL